MSRGLGSSQRLILRALRALEEDNAADGYQGRFRVSAIVDKAYALSGPLQDRKRRQDEALAADKAGLRRMAEDGNDLAREGLMLDRSLIVSRHSPRRCRKSPWISETALNPSRVLALLAARGLVDHNPVQGGGGGAGLTEAGRQAAAEHV